MRRTSLLVSTFALAFACAALLTQVRASGVSTHETPARASGLYAPPVPSPTSPRKIDEYGNLRWSDEMARLDNAAIEFQSDPSAICYLICYGGRVGREGAALRRCSRAAAYLVKRRGIESRRVITVDGGFREELTVEICPVPDGAMPPMSSPTVNPSDVRFVKEPRRRVRRRR